MEVKTTQVTVVCWVRTTERCLQGPGLFRRGGSPGVGDTTGVPWATDSVSSLGSSLKGLPLLHTFKNKILKHLRFIMATVVIVTKGRRFQCPNLSTRSE